MVEGVGQDQQEGGDPGGDRSQFAMITPRWDNNWSECGIRLKELVDLTMEQDEETENEHFIVQDNDMDDKEEDVDENS